MRNKKRRSTGDVSRWCSDQSNAFMTPEHRKFRRAHGLQFPLHPQQVVGWIVISIIIINTFVVLMPHIKPNLRSMLTVVITGIFVTHICSHLVVLLMDPADPRVRSQPSNKILPEFDRDKHSHVIENGRCHLCNITTDSRRTKHCSICNKCIVRFDHHCKWLNNCIGARNYSAFLICLVSAILANLFVAGLSATELFLSFFFDGSTNYIETNGMTKNTMATIIDPLIVPVSNTATLIAIFAIGILSAIAAILLLHLCFFHGYIACLGLTTYEYVRKKREKKSVGTAVAIAAAAATAAVAPPASSGGATTTAVANTTTVTVSSNIVKLAGDTVHSSSTSVQTVSNPTTGHDFSQLSSARYCYGSLIRNDTDLDPFQGTQGRIVFRGKSKPIVIQSVFSYCRNKRETTHLCVTAHVQPPQSNETSRGIRTTNIEQSTSVARHLAAGLPLPSPHICHSTALNCMTTRCCSMQNRADESKQRYNRDVSVDSGTVSTNTCVAVGRIEKCLRAHLNNSTERRCRANANTRQRSSDIKLNTRGTMMPEVNTSRGTGKKALSKNAGPIVDALTHLDEAAAIIASHPSVKIPSLYHPTLITQLNECVVGDSVTARLQKTLEPPAHERYFAARFASQKRTPIKMSHMPPSMKLSPILESELSCPDRTQSPNRSQTPAFQHSALPMRTPCSPHLSRSEPLSSTPPRIDRFDLSSSEM